MVPKAAIVLHENITGQTAIELYRIYEGRLTSPRRISNEEANELANVIGTREGSGFNGILPPGTLYVNEYKMAFLISAGEHIILLDAKDGKKVKEHVWMPQMLFVFSEQPRNLSVYWCSGTPSNIFQGAKCFLPAPLPNTNDGGNVCLGDSMQKKQLLSDVKKAQDQVLKSFFGSTFNEWRYEYVAPILKHCGSLTGKGKATLRNQFFSGQTTCPELNSYINQEKWQSLTEILRVKSW